MYLIIKSPSSSDSPEKINLLYISQNVHCENKINITDNWINF